MFVLGYGKEWSVCSDEEGIVGQYSGGDELVGGLYVNLVSLFGVIVTAKPVAAHFCVPRNAATDDDAGADGSGNDDDAEAEDTEAGDCVEVDSGCVVVGESSGGAIDGKVCSCR